MLNAGLSPAKNCGDKCREADRARVLGLVRSGKGPALQGCLASMRTQTSYRWDIERAMPHTMPPILRVSHLSKVYKGGFTALNDVSLELKQGEIFALLGPNGAGKTTLISIVCGLVNPTGGTVEVSGHDIIRDYRPARELIGLVPQELKTDSFETVWNTVSFSRGLFGKPRNDAHIERVLKDLSLWDKKDNMIMTLSGGMKRRVLIAKALSHEPRVLFLDEPTAGVDVELRRDMWRLVRQLRDEGVTIILTTHYLEEAEEMADRIGVIRKGELMLVDEKEALMRRFGQKRVTIQLSQQLTAIPAAVARTGLTLSQDGRALLLTLGTTPAEAPVSDLFRALALAGIAYSDIETQQSSLEDIFVELMREHA